MKTYRFRHPGMADAVAVVATPELSDLSDGDLKRLVRDLRYRVMVRDTALTVERFLFPTMISQTMWATLWRAALEESHARARLEHIRLGFRWTGFCGSRTGPADLELERRMLAKRMGPAPASLGAFLREKLAGASDVRPARRDEATPEGDQS